MDPTHLVPAWSAPAGRIRPLHGINNGPLCAGGLVALTARHRELGVPWIRLHDCCWPEPLVVDMPRIVVRPDLDPDDPAAYDFRRTDDYLRGVAGTGARIIYRLGTSIEHTRTKYDTAAPPDPAHYARFCLGVVRHCNDGWAGGLHLGISHWEIWNEPDLGDRMWQGDVADFLRLYTAVARVLKAHDPTLQVGGPGICTVHRDRYLPELLELAAGGGAPLDFVSWHIYGSDPLAVGADARFLRQLLDGKGLTRTASLCTEWNYTPPGWNWDYSSEESRTRFAEGMDSQASATYAAAVLLDLQDAPIDIANYYSGDTFWFGLFDTYGRPRKPFWAFRRFRDLLDTPCRVALAGLPAGVTACAGLAEDGRSAAVMVAQHGTATHDLALDLAGLPWSGSTQAEWQLLGDQGPRLSTVVLAGGRTPALQLPQPSTGFLRLRPA